MRTGLRTGARLLTVVLAGSCLTGAAAGAASAAPVGGWQRSPAQDFTAAAGALCPFALRSTVVLDQVYVRTTRTFADGSPRTQEFVGPLVVRLTDLRNGRTVQRDLSGRAVVQHRRDGGSTYDLDGPVAVGFHPGDGLPPGYYVLRGTHRVVFSATGVRAVTVDQGAEEDLCAVLARPV